MPDVECGSVSSTEASLSLSDTTAPKTQSLPLSSFCTNGKRPHQRGLEITSHETGEPELNKRIDRVKQILSLFRPKTRSLRFVFAATGICISYLAHGNITEDLFSYTSPVDNSKFRYAWLMQLLESCANVVAAYVVRVSIGGKHNRPDLSFFTSGVSQLFAKTFTSLALAAGLSYPVCTLAKSAKMIPVIIGQMIIGGASYTLSDFAIVGAIVCGTVILFLGEQKDEGGQTGATASTLSGLSFIFVALSMDGLTAGLQESLKSNSKAAGKSFSTNDFMLWTNLAMAITASVICELTGDWVDGWAFLSKNPEILRMVLISCICSVIGQSFIFYMIMHFDPLACSTVTTSRKIMSVLWSISAKNHHISTQGAFGVALAVAGLFLEVQNKILLSTRELETA